VEALKRGYVDAERARIEKIRRQNTPSQPPGEKPDARRQIPITLTRKAARRPVGME